MIPSEYLMAVRSAKAVVLEESDGLTPAQIARITHLRHVALEVFEDQGPDRATVEEISARAGISSRTFFRYFPSKEAVLFSDHATHLASLDRDLVANADANDRMANVSAALSSVARDLLKDDRFIQRRACLVHEHAALRDQEILWLQEYERRVSDYLDKAPGAPSPPFRVQMVAAAILSAFRHSVLAASRSGGPTWSLSSFERAVLEATSWYAENGDDRSSPRPTIVVTTNLSPAEVSAALDSWNDNQSASET